MKRTTILASALAALIMGSAAMPALAASGNDDWNGQGQGTRQMLRDCDGPHGPGRGRADMGPRAGMGPGGGQGMAQNRQAPGPNDNVRPGQGPDQRYAMRGGDFGPAGPRGMMNNGGPRDFAPGPKGGPQQGMRGPGPAMMGDLNRFDKDGDGYLSRDEQRAFANAAVQQMMAQRFDGFEKDSNGRIAIPDGPAPAQRLGPPQPMNPAERGPNN